MPLGGAQIILALSASIVPVANAFFILLIVVAICEPRCFFSYFVVLFRAATEPSPRPLLLR